MDAFPGWVKMTVLGKAHWVRVEHVVRVVDTGAMIADHTGEVSYCASFQEPIAEVMERIRAASSPRGEGLELVSTSEATRGQVEGWKRNYEDALAKLAAVRMELGGLVASRKSHGYATYAAHVEALYRNHFGGSNE